MGYSIWIIIGRIPVMDKGSEGRRRERQQMGRRRIKWSWRGGRRARMGRCSRGLIQQAPEQTALSSRTKQIWTKAASPPPPTSCLTTLVTPTPPEATKPSTTKTPTVLNQTLTQISKKAMAKWDPSLEMSSLDLSQIGTIQQVCPPRLNLRQTQHSQGKRMRRHFRIPSISAAL